MNRKQIIAKLRAILNRADIESDGLVNRKLSSKHSSEIEVLLELGQSYLLNKEYENAIKKFGEALKINPHDPEVYYYLGLAYEGDNKLEDAINMYEKTLGLDETFNNAEIRLNKLKNKMNEKPEKSEEKT